MRIHRSCAGRDRANPASLQPPPSIVKPDARRATRLSQLQPGRRARVSGIAPPAARPEWARLLADIGFAAGEPVQVLRRAPIGGDPIVVRIGASTFALRRAEADCVEVELAA
ncbi:MAG: ferrous iron transport protein A [Burkholderiales bacterium]|nr:ferrous iron transport protein A [Burkholderiales bacterium]